MSAPERIWLQWVSVADIPEHTTWCEDQVDDADIPYIRADLVPSPAAIRAEALEEAAAVVGALVHVDDTSEYQQGVLDAEEAVRALIAQPAEGGGDE